MAVRRDGLYSRNSRQGWSHRRHFGLDASPVFRGPPLEEQLNFSEAFTYDVRKNPVRGLAWPDNETKTQGFDSLTNFQAMLSPRHLLTVSVNGFSNRRQFADISALVPQT